MSYEAIIKEIDAAIEDSEAQIVIARAERILILAGRAAGLAVARRIVENEMGAEESPFEPQTENTP